MNENQNRWDWKKEYLIDLSKERFKKKLERHESERNDDRVYYFCIERCDRVLVGISIIDKINRELQRAEIGFQLNNKYWGQGYGKDVCRSLVRIARNHLNLRMIVAFIHLQNEPSIQYC